ncbi:hypothetical protein SLEP1_g29985 [Rubroshorea leprosula]|uniref:Uncharacterized protein n=1 Tax=Rubroshorea leprosula TaxID=152421 RepID=A0AAV5JYM0_9ROSI|nr:hypothetical protein SLEP1_g29985 [Rubroshorea leprosula]
MLSISKGDGCSKGESNIRDMPFFTQSTEEGKCNHTWLLHSGGTWNWKDPFTKELIDRNKTMRGNSGFSSSPSPS